MAQYKALNGQGIGEVNYLTDDDVRAYSLSDFGIRVSNESD